MDIHISEQILSFLEEAGGAAGDAVLLALLAAPFAILAAWCILRLCRPGLRKLSSRWVCTAGDICLLLFLCLCLLRPQLRERLYAAAVLAVLLRLLLFALSPLLRLPFAKRARRQPQPAPPPQEPAPEPAAEPAPLPAKVRCYEEERPVVIEKDVRLGHIFTVLERLKRLPLSPGDRLEIEKTEQLLTIYRTKEVLNAKEAETLNDILAVLLKMMGKYKL